MIITNALYTEIDRLRARVAELEAERDGYRNGQWIAQQLQNTLSTVNAKWANDYKELEAENKRLRKLLHRCLMGGVFFASDLVDEIKQALGEASHE